MSNLHDWKKNPVLSEEYVKELRKGNDANFNRMEQIKKEVHYKVRE